MILQQPKVEFIQLNVSEAIYTSYGTGGGQYCKGSQPNAPYCAGWVDQIGDDEEPCANWDVDVPV